MPVKHTDNTHLLKKALEKLAKNKLEIGIYDDEEKARLGSLHEIGTATMPPRPWLAQAMSGNIDKYAEDLSEMVQAALDNNTDPMKALEALGAQAESDVRNYIRSGQVTPPLAQSTIDKKGHSIPLLDTGGMVDAIKHRIVPQNKKE